MGATYIQGIGIANPKFKYEQYTIFEFMSLAHGLNPHEKNHLRKIYDASGIKYRHSVLEDYDKTPGDFVFYGNLPELEPFPSTKTRSELFEKTGLSLCLNAFENCIAGIPDFDLASITHLITLTCTGLHAPGLDIELVSNLGLNPDTERTAINFMGCYAAFNALKIADYICRSNPSYKVLIVGVELCTLHFQKENSLQNWLANALFADGAAAILLGSGFSEIEFSNEIFPLSITGFHSTLVLEGKQEMAWRIGNHGFEMNLGTHVAKKVKSNIGSLVNELLKKVNMKKEEISHFAIHPGGRRILEVCEEEIPFKGGRDHASYQVLENYGNMSSVTIFFVLQTLLKDIKKGKVALENGNIMALAFGPGLTLESMILQIKQ